MARKNQYPTSKIIATTLGAALCGLEAWLNSEYFAHIEGTWASPTIFIVAMATVGGAAALPIAERAHRAGQKIWSFCLVFAFIFMAAFSLFTTFARLDDKRTGEVVTARTGDGRVRLAREAYQDAKAARDAECVKRGERCRAAEQAVIKAGEKLQALPAERGEESQTKQLGSIVTLYAFPLGQLLIGFGLLAFGLSPRAGEPAGSEKAQPKQIRKPRKRKLSAVSQLEGGNVVRLQTRAR